MILSYAFLVLIPALNGAPLRAIELFHPDIGLGLRVSGCAAAAWALLNLLVMFKHRHNQG